MDNQDSVRNVGLAAGQRGFLCMCSARVIYFLAAFLTLAVGLILGAVFAEEILPVVGIPQADMVMGAIAGEVADALVDPDERLHALGDHLVDLVR